MTAILDGTGREDSCNHKKRERADRRPTMPELLTKHEPP
jgi:hypothetical protein